MLDESRENLVELCPLHKEHTFHSICLKNEIEKFEEQLKNLTCQRCHSYINKHRLQHEDLQRKKNNLDVLKNMLVCYDIYKQTDIQSIILYIQMLTILIGII